MADIDRNRSIARLGALKKCAAEDRGAARLDALRKCAERNLVKASADRSALRREALTKCALLELASTGGIPKTHNMPWFSRKSVGPKPQQALTPAQTAGGLAVAGGAATVAGAGAAGLPLAAGAGGFAAGAGIRKGVDKMTGGAMTRGLENFGDRVGNWWARKFGPKPVTVPKTAADRSVAHLEGIKKCAAEDRGELRRLALTKAAGLADTLLGSAKVPYTPGIISNLLANEDLQRALVGAAATGATAAVTSDRKNRWRNALIAAAAGGVGTYGLSATGALDNFFSPYSDINAQAKKFMRGQHAMEITRSLRGPDKSNFYEQIRSQLESMPHKTHSVQIGV